MIFLEKTKKLCDQYGVVPSRSKGQNFLVNEGVYDRIISAADLKPDDIVLEVGPGLGFLTERLAKRVNRVITVELDDKLADVLRERIAREGINNVEVVNENILEVRSEKLEVRSNGYKIVANLPYNITSHFLRKFLENEELRPDSMVLMLQKEVAERITAKPGKMSLLAVSVQYYAEPEIVSYVPKEDFWPRPEVDSAIVKLNVGAIHELPVPKEFFRLVRIGFSARRKMLKNNLAAGYQIEAKEAGKKIKMAGFSENCRAQELSVKDWIKLSDFFITKP